MKNLKQLFAFLTAFVLCFSLAACSSETESDDTDSEDDETTSEVEEDTAIEPEELELDLTVYEDDDVALNVTYLELDEEGMFYVTLELENNSEDEYYFAAYVSFNALDPLYISFVNDGFFYETLDAGETDEEEIDMDYTGIFTSLEDIGQINVIFTLCDKTTNTYLFTQQEYIVYPYGEEAASVYSRDEDDQVLVDTDSYKATVADVEYVEGEEEDDQDEILVTFYLENGYDFRADFYMTNVIVNDASDTVANFSFRDMGVGSGHAGYLELEVTLNTDSGMDGLDDLETITFDVEIVEDGDSHAYYEDSLTIEF